MKKGITFCVWMGCLMVLLFAINLLVGAVDIPSKEVVNILMGNDSGHPSWQYIVLQSRLPQAITAMLCGASLAVSGLMLQTAFHNPLAGPSIFGINSGASLGVALVMLLLGPTARSPSNTPWNCMPSSYSFAMTSGAYIISIM